MKTRTQRAARVLSERVARITPAGIPWEALNDWVNPPGTLLDRALMAWDAEDTPDTRRRLKETGEAWVSAWRGAVRAWKAEGRPGAEKLGRECNRAERVGMITDAPAGEDHGEEAAA